MALYLSQADQYHLNVRTCFASHIKNAELKVHFFLPSQLAEHDDINQAHNFYQNLLQKQIIRSSVKPSLTSIERNLLILKQTAFAKSQSNIHRYRKALSDFISDIRDLHQIANEPDEMVQIYDFIKSFQLLHEDEDKISDGRLFRLSNTQVMFYFYQSLLKLANRESYKNNAVILNLIFKIKQYANLMSISLDHDSEEGRERLHHKLHVARKVINSPYRVIRKRLSTGKLVEQVIFGVSAAVAMAFATGVAFLTQKSFGNFSTPFFVSLVVSYIFKDRLKELGRNYLVAKFSARYFQNQFRLCHGSEQHEIVLVKETLFRKKNVQLPSNIQALLKRLPAFDMNSHKHHHVYRRTYGFRKFWHSKVDMEIHDELTLNLSRILRSLPKILSTHYYSNEKIQVFVPNGYPSEQSGISATAVHKIHTIYVLLSLQVSEKIEYQQYRIVVSRIGIHKIYPVDVNEVV